MATASWTRRGFSTYTCATTNTRMARWCGRKVGDGEFDNLGQIRAMLKDGYKGTFTLETHWRDPKGKTYSSEQSFKALLEVVAKV